MGFRVSNVLGVIGCLQVFFVCSLALIAAAAWADDTSDVSDESSANSGADVAAVVTWVLESGGSVTADDDDPGKLIEIDLRSTNVDNVKLLAGLPHLRKLDLRGTKVTDLSPLAELASLEELYLHRSPAVIRQEAEDIKTLIKKKIDGIKPYTKKIKELSARKVRTKRASSVQKSLDRQIEKQLAKIEEINKEVKRDTKGINRLSREYKASRYQATDEEVKKLQRALLRCKVTRAKASDSI